MTTNNLTLFYHPLASYCWKALIALYENGTPFEKRIIDLGDAAERAELSALWPLCKFPVLRDGDRVVAESSIIVEYLDHHHAGPRSLLPKSVDEALDVRSWDRVFDNYVQTPMQEIVLARLQGAQADLSRAYATLLTAYELADKQLASSPWIVGNDFSLADCAAVPALFYAVTLQPFPAHCSRLSAYFDRVVERPSVRRTLVEAKPYFKDYPFGSAIATRFR
jgi:glutathione S-transferase